MGVGGVQDGEVGVEDHFYLIFQKTDTSPEPKPLPFPTLCQISVW